MPDNVLVVKNMVCHRCQLAVENILADTSIPFTDVTIGEIHLPETIEETKHAQLSSALAKIGLELVDNRMSGLIEKLKQLVIRKARAEVSAEENKINLSAFLSKNLHYEYTYLSSLFSSVEGRTIENYYLHQRIEKVKELLVYNEMTLAAIAFELQYSSVAHLSNQFKQITGLTPSHFRKIGSTKRKLIDQV